jgi:hypothetical protein
MKCVFSLRNCVSASTQESLIVALSQNVVVTLDYWAMIFWVTMGKYLTNN